jgi:hypothetical protein
MTFQRSKKIHKRGTMPFLLIFASIVLALGMVWLTSSPVLVKAASSDLSMVRTRYTVMSGSRIDSCNLCHTASIPALNSYGAAYKAKGRTDAALVAIQGTDTDGDGFTNLQELNALTFPGDAADHPVLPTATKTNTPVPPTATKTNTPIPPTATKTNTPVPPTSTKTNTPVPPTPTNTNTVVPTATSTNPVVPSATSTDVPQSVATDTSTPDPAVTNTTEPLPLPTSTDTVQPNTPQPVETRTQSPTKTKTLAPTKTKAAVHNPTRTKTPKITRTPTRTPRHVKSDQEEHASQKDCGDSEKRIPTRTVQKTTHESETGMFDSVRQWFFGWFTER